MHRSAAIETALSPGKRGECSHTASRPYSASVRAQVDKASIVKMVGDDAIFMSGRDDVVRYHASGITVSRMEDTGELVSTCAGGVRDGSSDMEEPMGCILSEYEVGLLVLYIRAGDVFSL